LPVHVRIFVPAIAIPVIALVLLAGCGSSHRSPSVPSLAGGGTSSSARAPAAPGGTGPDRVAALHAAAQCIREHGAPTYQDPVLTADGHVYTDARSIQDLDRKNRGTPTLDAIRRACGTLITAAGFQPDDEAPAPPQLVEAGVKAARCLRANGLPNYRDPTSSTQFTPGHGFGITADEVPAGGKADPTVQRAFGACRGLLDEEIRQSTLGNLSHG
jgi:hypothetical protein